MVVIGQKVKYPVGDQVIYLLLHRDPRLLGLSLRLGIGDDHLS